jgi:hypothetical protein
LESIAETQPELQPAFAQILHSLLIVDDYLRREAAHCDLLLLLRDRRFLFGRS